MKNRIIQANHLAAFTQNLRREEKSAATIEKSSRDVAQLGRDESVMPRCRGGGEQSVSPQFAASFCQVFL